MKTPFVWGAETLTIEVYQEHRNPRWKRRGLCFVFSLNADQKDSLVAVVFKRMSRR